MTAEHLPAECRAGLVSDNVRERRGLLPELVELAKPRSTPVALAAVGALKWLAVADDDAFVRRDALAAARRWERVIKKAPLPPAPAASTATSPTGTKRAAEDSKTSRPRAPATPRATASNLVPPALAAAARSGAGASSRAQGSPPAAEGAAPQLPSLHHRGVTGASAADPRPATLRTAAAEAAKRVLARVQASSRPVQHPAAATSTPRGSGPKQSPLPAAATVTPAAPADPDSPRVSRSTPMATLVAADVGAGAPTLVAAFAEEVVTTVVEDGRLELVGFGEFRREDALGHRSYGQFAGFKSRHRDWRPTPLERAPASNFSARVGGRAGLSKHEGKVATQAVLNAILHEAEAERTVRVGGLGTFSRIGHNLAFGPSGALQQRLRDTARGEVAGDRQTSGR